MEVLLSEYYEWVLSIIFCPNQSADTRRFHDWILAMESRGEEITQEIQAAIVLKKEIEALVKVGSPEFECKFADKSKQLFECLKYIYQSYMIVFSFHDKLTELPNRTLFDLMVGNLIGTRGVMVMLDIDFFKSINDSHGHSTGDRVLNYFGRMLKQTFSDEAILCRHGGEEFVMFFQDSDEKFVESRLENFKSVIGAHDFKSEFGDTFNVSCSIGVTSCQLESDLFSVFNKVDRVLYLAKQHGRNAIHVI